MIKFVIGISLLGLVQAGRPAVPDYVNSRFSFRFTPPTGWRETKQDYAEALFSEPVANKPSTISKPLPGESSEEFLKRVKKVVSKPIDVVPKFIANLSVTATPTTSKSVQEYCQGLKKKGSLPEGFRIVGEAPFSLSGVPAMARSLRVSSPGQPGVQTREVICLRNGYALNITLAADASLYGKYKAVFDQVLGSFAWTAPPR